MRVGSSSGRVVLLLTGSLLASVIGCSPAPPPKPLAPASASVEVPAEPPSPATKEDVVTGKDCLKAQKLCAGGACDVTVQNGCDAAATCDAFATAKCKSSTQLLEAKGRKRATIPAKTDDTINVTAECSEGEVVYTDLTDLKCK